MTMIIHPPDYMDHMDDDFDPSNDWIGYAESAGICPYCGETMLDDIEVGQGYCVTAPCWMWANGMIADAVAWEREHYIAVNMDTSPDVDELCADWLPVDVPKPRCTQYPRNKRRRWVWPPVADRRGYVA